MERINLADAKTHLSDLVNRAERGEEIEIIKRGKLVAMLTPPRSNDRKPIDFEALKAFTDGQPYQEESAADLIRRMRDDGY